MVGFDRQLKGWESKPLLRTLYYEFYSQMLHRFKPGIVLELGSGIKWMPSVIHSDLPDVSAYNIPYPDHSVDTIVLFDVFHHLDEPDRFMQEVRRVLKKDGRLVMCEPYLSFGSFWFYLFHDESLSQTARCQKYFWKKHWLFFEHIVSFTYLFSGGYSWPSLVPRKRMGMFRRMDEFFSHYPRLFACRCIVVMDGQ